MHHVDDLAGRIGQELGVSDWITLDQERIDWFAQATATTKWSTWKPNAPAAGPFGATIAHGYLTLSVVTVFLAPVLDLEGVSMSLNYGVDRVRFPHPVRVGSRIRSRVTVESVEETARGVRLGMACVMEIDG